MNQIRITPGSTATFDIDLQGRRYTFKFLYNPRLQLWSVNLYLAGAPLVLGQLCVMGVELFRGLADPLVPRGLYFAPLDKSTEDATYDELGARVILVELEEGDGINAVSI